MVEIVKLWPNIAINGSKANKSLQKHTNTGNNEAITIINGVKVCNYQRFGGNSARRG